MPPREGRGEEGGRGRAVAGGGSEDNEEGVGRVPSGMAGGKAATAGGQQGEEAGWGRKGVWRGEEEGRGLTASPRNRITMTVVSP